ncbi:MAG: hypothetical protein ABFD62_00540 [Syntrophaceae bacterium]
MNGISRETFEAMNDSSKLNVLYDCAISSNQKMTALEKKVDRRKVIDTSVAGVSGVIGGMIAFFTQKLFR